MECKFEFESDGILEAHKKNQKKHFTCDICSKSFEHKKGVDEHKEKDHKKTVAPEEWNCDDCAFQANCASELMKHLKVTGHQPSKNIKDKRKVFEDYKQCFTCKMDFDGFYNLMNHRKIVHPSNKKCRNFSNGTCVFDDDCWYVHSKKTDNGEDTSDQFRCDLCDTEFKGRSNFMNHRKLQHLQFVPSCEKFNTKQCPRSNEKCWFEHRISDKNVNKNNPWSKNIKNSQPQTESSVFHEAVGETFPPDQVKLMLDMVNNLCRKMDNMEKQIKDLKE